MRFINGAVLCALSVSLVACSSLDRMTESVTDTISGVFESEQSPVLSEVSRTENVAALENPSQQQQQLVSAESRERYQAAVDLLQAGKLLEAKAAFQALHAAHANYSGPLVNLGLIAEAESDEASALAYYAQAIKANPSNQQAYNRQGLLLRKQGAFEAAEASYLAAIAQWPSYAPIRMNLGILYEVYMGRLADAMAQYQAYQALQETPDRKVNAWLADLGRRVQVQSKGQ